MLLCASLISVWSFAFGMDFLLLFDANYTVVQLSTDLLFLLLLLHSYFFTKKNCTKITKH